MLAIDRDEHLAYLETFYEECRKRRGRAVLLEGPAASGKTELLRVLADRASAAGATVLNAICSPAERTLPFGVVGQLFQSVTLPDQLAAQVKELLETGAASPALDAPEPAVVDPGIGQVFYRLCAVLLGLAQDTPLLIGIDDMRYADVPSQRCLLYLTRRIGSARVLAVLTDDADAQLEPLPFRSELLRQPHSERIGLAPLSPEGVDRLLASRAEAPQGLAAAFFSATGGNLALLHALLHDHRVLGDARAEGYGRAFLNQLRRGEATLLEVVRALAVLDEDASPALLARLAGTDTETVRRTLRTMNAAGLLDEGAFRHPVARSAVLADLPAADRSDLHHRAAHLLYDMGCPSARVAHHLIEVDHPPHPWAADVLVETAEQELLAGRVQLAVRCLETAHESHDASERARARIRAKLACAQWQLNPSVAAKHLAPLTTAARAGQLDQSERASLVRKLLWHGRTDEAVGVLDGMREVRREQQGENAARLLDLELWLAFSHPALARRRRLPAARTRHRGGPVTPAVDPWLHPTVTMTDLFTRGRSAEAAECAELVLRDLRLSHHACRAGESVLLALLTLLYADRAETAVEWCDRLSAGTESANFPAWRAKLAAVRAEAAVRRGNLSEAVQQAKSAMTRLSPRAWGVAVGLPLGSLVMAATRRGDYEEAATFLARPVPETMFQSRYGLHYLHARGHHHLATDHAYAALADFLSCGELMRGWGLDVAGLVPWRTSAAEAWLRLGNEDQARVFVHDQLARPGTEGPRTRGLSLRLLAATSAVGQRPQLLTEALELFEECDDRFEQGRVLTDLGRAYNALDQRQRTRMVFRRARHMAAICEAAPLSEELLAVHGESSPTAAAPKSPEGIDLLTDSEHRVASLAVLGCTNREIAAKLYVTPSTVEQHLTNAYRKLRIKRRRDLPADLTIGAADSRQARSVSRDGTPRVTASWAAGAF